MIKTPVPHNEADRIEALRRYCILDTDPEHDFDDLAHLASRICGTAIALVSLIDADRQWLKTNIGLSTTQPPRETAFWEACPIQGSIAVRLG